MQELEKCVGGGDFEKGDEFLISKFTSTACGAMHSACFIEAATR